MAKLLAAAIVLIALHPIDHDGERYDEGDSLEVFDKRQADQLVKSGSAVLDVPAAPRKRAPDAVDVPTKPARATKGKAAELPPAGAADPGADGGPAADGHTGDGDSTQTNTSTDTTGAGQE